MATNIFYFYHPSTRCSDHATTGGQALVLPIPLFDLTVRTPGSPAEVVESVRLLVLLTVLSLVPAIMMMVTSFTRTVIVLSLVRTAVAAQNVPPNQVIIGLALFITFFTMTPTITALNDSALTPFLNGEINQEVALERGAVPLREFMLQHTREADLALFLMATDSPAPQTPQDVSLNVLIPAFMISELKTAFQMGVILFIPFMVIDMVVASTLLSMGMFMLPPVTISLPFKLLLFVMADGWHLVVKSLIESF
ncbi:MAG: flagellar type III secretion system pore protein FliP [Firmicutes bacterium]|nr:flagellar type III secretion system pore protein FliP [Dethiobacter sp.]MBS3888649.1 flagellar type III secretion system pore protein FliP [Bacillota bacterium]